MLRGWSLPVATVLLERLPSTAEGSQMKSSLMQFHWIRIICQNIFRCQQAVRRVDDPIEAILLSNPEKTVALRKLVEAKDCSVRAVLFKDGHKCRQDWLPNVDTATDRP